MRGIEVVSTRQNRWAELLREHARSGLSVDAFCRRYGVSDQSFYNWRKQLSGLAGDDPVRFARVVAGAPATKDMSAIELILASGDRVRIATGIDAVSLRKVLQVLREHA